MGLLDKIAEIEKEISRTQKNKATEHHIGLLKAKLAKYRSQVIELSKPSGGKGEGFDVMKSGDARVSLIGFPSVGKSTFLNSVTAARSACADYEFTTLTCIPGVIKYMDAEIQLLDLPGIIKGASDGKGRGKQVLAVARSSDLILMMLDPMKAEGQRFLLEQELHSCGIRLNKSRPNVTFKATKTGGVKITKTCELVRTTERLALQILQEYKIFNCNVLFREDIDPDDFADIILGHQVYIPCIYVYNKIDSLFMEDVDLLARLPHSVVISCNLKLNFDGLLAKIWKCLGLVRIYTKKAKSPPDFSEPIILRRGANIEHVCHRIHRELASQFKYAMLWGTSVKFVPQRVGLTHLVQDEDVIQIFKN